jgi:hypothetical protein
VAGIPPQLKKRPFTLEEARALGLTRRALQSRNWRRIGSSIYCWRGWTEDEWQLLHAWHRRLPNAIFTGLTAGWLYRHDVDPCHPIEVAVPNQSGVRSRPGLVVRRIAFDRRDLTRVRGLPAPSLSWLFRDLRSRLSRVEYLVLADQALKLNLGRFDELAEPAESPMETRLRWLLIEAGLPRPEVQAKLSFGRADLYVPRGSPRHRVLGVNHRDRLVEDNRRQNLLMDAGFRLLRFSAADIYQRPDSISRLVHNAMK